MQRNTAVAAASAISMGLLSAAVAIGANFGALGFSASSPTPPSQPAAVTAAAVNGPAPVESTASTTPVVVRATRATERETEEHTQQTFTQEESRESDD
ncbi:MAG: hypothetical protein ABWZ15_15675 [Acidimicrobiia bacterium]